MARTGKVAAGLQLFQPPAAGGDQPGGPLGGPITFMFNPNELALSKSANWIPHVARAAEDVGVAEFSGSGPRTLSLTIFLDATEKHDRSVQERVEKLLTCCVPTKASIAAKAPSPPWVKFTWGQFQTVSFYSYVSQIDANYKLFDPDGTPLRATCTLTLTEISGSTPGQNPTSGALTAQRVHRLVAGDTLEMLAYREYGDPTIWRVIAEANEIDDPTRLRPGRQLLLPAVEG
ncbi:peptidase M23 [Actinoplanes cyaneus]|uniref:Peptidase M23 n=1 Tax=Actinoplanes cyaneus TaxID=52696 RepID=A0A919IFH9_9ACTN|nr:LysM peptidoglycan-binding domain-containing protein [Actinoplanes cyaneus]MCW2136607.1 LysM domain-containing protein [Actinoplanes cyaneus]GID64246.1 peptidase M23 [Actinoplanes cyaneus]